MIVMFKDDIFGNLQLKARSVNLAFKKCTANDLNKISLPELGAA
ncbi:hypothetical protein AIGOOFII_2951 [Methylobacterium marchantiae]|nr:hypothetical protein AIGOOFII_2951 [Methylobacterium marchantiae]